MPRKLRYEIDLSKRVQVDTPDDVTVRAVSREDLDGLARLMLDAYIGTIDYEGEDLDDAMDEVETFFDDGQSLLDRSLVVEAEGSIVSAILVSIYEGEPFIGYVMTLPSHKNHGLARLATTIALENLATDGDERAVLYITEGNVASEALFRSVGAVLRDS